MTSLQVIEEADHFEEFALSTEDPEMKMHWYKQALSRIMRVVHAGEVPSTDLVQRMDTYTAAIEAIDQEGASSNPISTPRSPDLVRGAEGDDGGSPGVPIFGRLKHSIVQIANRCVAIRWRHSLVYVANVYSQSYTIVATSISVLVVTALKEKSVSLYRRWGKSDRDDEERDSMDEQNATEPAGQYDDIETNEPSNQWASDEPERSLSEGSAGVSEGWEVIEDSDLKDEACGSEDEEEICRLRQLPLDALGSLGCIHVCAFTCRAWDAFTCRA